MKIFQHKFILFTFTAPFIIAASLLSSGCSCIASLIPSEPLMGNLTAYVDNKSPDNLLVYVDDTLRDISFAQSSPLSVYSWSGDDVTISVKDPVAGSTKTVVIKKGTVGKPVLTIVIPAFQEPQPGVTQFNKLSVVFENPNDEQVVISLDKNPMSIIYGHRSKWVDFKIPIDVTVNTQFLVEARTPSDLALYTEVFTLKELDKPYLSVTLPPLLRGKFSLTIENFSDQYLRIFVNGQKLGDIDPNADKLFDASNIEPHFSLNETYLAEARDNQENILFSKSFNWQTLDMNKFAISIPFTDGPKIIVFNNSPEELKVVVNDKILGSVLPNSRKYFDDPAIFAKFDGLIKFDNSKGREVYSQRLYGLSGLDPDIKIDIPPQTNQN